MLPPKNKHNKMRTQQWINSSQAVKTYMYACDMVQPFTSRAPSCRAGTTSMSQVPRSLAQQQVLRNNTKNKISICMQCKFPCYTTSRIPLQNQVRRSSTQLSKFYVASRGCVTRSSIYLRKATTWILKLLINHCGVFDVVRRHLVSKHRPLTCSLTVSPVQQLRRDLQAS